MKKSNVLLIGLCLVFFLFFSSGLLHAMVVNAPENRDENVSLTPVNTDAPDTVNNISPDTIGEVTIGIQVPEELRIPFVEKMESLYKKHNIKVKDLEFLKDPKSPGVYNYKATLTARMADLKLFFEALNEEFSSDK